MAEHSFQVPMPNSPLPFKVVRTSKYGDVQEKFHFLENARFKTLEHLLKTF